MLDQLLQQESGAFGTDLGDDRIERSQPLLRFLRVGVGVRQAPGGALPQLGKVIEVHGGLRRRPGRRARGTRAGTLMAGITPERPAGCCR